VFRLDALMQPHVGTKMPRRTWIKNAEWIIACDKVNGCQSYLQNADLVLSGNSITFVGRRTKVTPASSDLT